MSSTSKKEMKTYHFNADSEHDFFVTMVNEKCCYLICLTSPKIPKKGNIERHFLSLHNNFQTDYPPKSELRKRKVKDLKTQLKKQQNLFKKPILKSQAAITASFKACYLLSKQFKQFSGGEFVKETSNYFCNSRASAFPKYSNATN